MKKILLSGSIAYDNVMTYDGKFTDLIKPESIDNLSIAFLIKEKSVHFGGCSGNIAFSMSLLGEYPIVMAIAGKDFDNYAEWMRENEIDTKYIKIGEKDTACAFITSDQDGRQITSFYPGAMMEEVEIDLSEIKDEVELALISPENQDTMLKIINECKKYQIPYFFDPGQQLPAFSQEQLVNAINGAKGIFVNDYEFGLLKEKSGLVEDDLLRQVEMLVITKGEKGSIIITNDQQIDVPIVKPKEVVDPTGCGDAYRAGFLKGMLEGKELKECGQMGAEMAARVIEKAGTQNHGL